MTNNEQLHPTYEELAQAWGIDRTEIEKARKSTAEQLIEGEHFTRDPDAGGALRFSPAGQVILADDLGFSLACDVPQLPEVDEPPTVAMAEELGAALADEASYPVAIAFFQRFPTAVAKQVRRMISNPTEAEAPLVYGAMQLAFGQAADPKPLLTQSQEVN